VKEKHIESPRLFDRIVEILETARKTAYRSINNTMVTAYWNIGKEIIEDEQQGELRAEYGKAIIMELSQKLTGLYGRGFDPSNLRYMRLFYQKFSICDALSHKSSNKNILPCVMFSLMKTGIFFQAGINLNYLLRRFSGKKLKGNENSLKI
jgi:hypothetical protein